MGESERWKGGEVCLQTSANRRRRDAPPYLGGRLLEQALQHAKERLCVLLQFTTFASDGREIRMSWIAEHLLNRGGDFGDLSCQFLASCVKPGERSENATEPQQHGEVKRAFHRMPPATVRSPRCNERVRRSDSDRA